MSQLLAHFFGDYILQSDWMATNKTKHLHVAMIHALVYSCCFIPLTWHHGPFCFLTIFATHVVIDRFRLARYVVWAKNWLGPVRACYDCNKWGRECHEIHYSPATQPLAECTATGYPPSTPIWLSTWLLIIADNTLHLAINSAALRWL